MTTLAAAVFVTATALLTQAAEAGTLIEELDERGVPIPSYETLPKLEGLVTHELDGSKVRLTFKHPAAVSFEVRAKGLGTLTFDEPIGQPIRDYSRVAHSALASLDDRYYQFLARELGLKPAAWLRSDLTGFGSKVWIWCKAEDQRDLRGIGMPARRFCGDLTGAARDVLKKAAMLWQADAYLLKAIDNAYLAGGEADPLHLQLLAARTALRRELRIHLERCQRVKASTRPDLECNRG